MLFSVKHYKYSDKIKKRQIGQMEWLDFIITTRTIILKPRVWVPQQLGEMSIFTRPSPG